MHLFYDEPIVFLPHSQTGTQIFFGVKLYRSNTTQSYFTSASIIAPITSAFCVDCIVP